MSTLEEHLAAPVEAKTFTVDDEQSAEWALRKVAQKRRQMAENQALATKEIERITQWLEDVNAPLESDAEYLEGLLTEFHRQVLDQDEDRKTIKLPAGTLKSRKAPDTVDIPDGFVEWARQHRPELVRTKYEADKPAIKQAVLKDGEVLPNVLVQRGEIRYSVEVGE